MLLPLRQTVEVSPTCAHVALPLRSHLCALLSCFKTNSVDASYRHSLLLKRLTGDFDPYPIIQVAFQGFYLPAVNQLLCLSVRVRFRFCWGWFVSSLCLAEQMLCRVADSQLIQILSGQPCDICNLFPQITMLVFSSSQLSTGVSLAIELVVANVVVINVCVIVWRRGGRHVEPPHKRNGCNIV